MAISGDFITKCGFFFRPLHLQLTARKIMPDMSSYFPITDPTVIFFVVLLIILFAPIIMGKLRIPHIIGMVLAGMAIGAHGLNILSRDASFELFGKVGMYYIMFLAALEMDMEGVKRTKKPMAIYGVLTFLLPAVFTFFATWKVLGYPLETGMLLGCLMASNTLVAYPVVGRYGLQRKPSVALSVGSSMISLFFALMMLAAIVGINRGNSDVGFWMLFAVRTVGLCVVLGTVIPRLTRYFLRRYSDAVMQFIFVLAMLFMSAVLSGLVGLEGILGAFLAGLIMNRYIPRLSPLMNRIEFIGNALFIPYFLIGVGMLINVRLLFTGSQIIWVAVIVTLSGTLGKALAAYASSVLFRMPWSSGHMMFGLTSAHAAGAIAMVMIGMKLTVGDNSPMIDATLLNGVVLMILFTCVISAIITDWSARQIVFRDKEYAPAVQHQDDEKMLVPVKYPEYADKLLSLAFLIRNDRRNVPVVCLNVVYDDEQLVKTQEEGRKLLEQLMRHAASADVQLQTQVRIAANIANGIKHAFKEFQASEILIGMHMHADKSNKFWGEFHQSLFNGLNCQIIMARLNQPLNTLRRIQVAVPSRAQYEPGFYRWMERLARMADNLECRIVFHAREDTMSMIADFVRRQHPVLRAEYETMTHWNELPRLATKIADDHLFVVVTARKGTVSYKSAQEKLPYEITRYFTGKNLMIIFPDQYGRTMDEMTFAQPQHTEEQSAYDMIHGWLSKHVCKKK